MLRETIKNTQFSIDNTVQLTVATSAKKSIHDFCEKMFID
ncbi:hypothetical protein AMBR_MGDJBKAP_01365 [Leuconostoc pseudomesenteroides]|nr:hypothetical protein AMBR_MGDJBKAP_01365 [Leuconostoc pseudomesenteroides]